MKNGKASLSLRRLSLALGFASAAVCTAAAAETDTASGGSITLSAVRSEVSGNKAAFQQLRRGSANYSGGIESLLFSREDSRLSFSLDGRFLPVEDDYRLSFRLGHENGLYSHFGYDRFKTYYNGTGRTFLPTDTFFDLADPRLGIDREKLWLEIGVARHNQPKAFLRFERHRHQGTKQLATLGESNLTGGAGSKAIVPTTLTIDEIRQILVAEISQSVGPRRWEISARYERSEQDNRRRTPRRPGEPAADRVTTTRDAVDTDLFSSHAFVEQEFNRSFRVSAGGLYASIDTALDGSRIYGATADAVYDPIFSRRQAGDLGFLALSGNTHLKQYVGNLNAVYLPFKNWTTRAGLRYQHLHQDSVSTFVATNVANNLTTSAVETGAETGKQENQLTGTFDVRYTGLPSLNCIVRGEWRHAAGDLDEMLYPTATRIPSIFRSTDYTRRFEKYSFATNWYAHPKFTAAAEYFFRVQDNDYQAPVDSTTPGGFDSYPAFVQNHRFDLHDVNLRTTWRVHPTLSLVTRYDLQLGRSFARFDRIPSVQSGRYTGHIVSQSFNWSPHPRLFLTGSGSLVFDQLATPAASFVLNSDNNYYNTSFTAGYALTKTTDLFAEYANYRASGFSDNSALSLPYGSQQRTDNVSLTCSVKPDERTRLTLKYAYASNRDKTFAGRNDFHAHIIYAKIQYQL